MDSLEDLKMPLLNFIFVIIYIIHKVLVLLKNQLNYFEDSIFECFFIKYHRFLSFFKLFFLSQHIMMVSLSLKKENVIKDIRNLFRLRKELNYTTIKNIRNLLS